MNASMTKRHFVALAQWFNREVMGKRTFTHEELAHSLADALSQFNANFDRDRFVSACLKESKCLVCRWTLED